MKHIPVLVILFFIFSITSCRLYQDPEFKKITVHGVPTLSKRSITIKSKAHFYNPNPIGCTLNRVSFEVFVNGKEAGVINQEFTKEISGSTDFTVPLYLTFSPAKVLNLNNLLKQALTSAVNKTLDVRYKGDLWLSIADHHLVIHLDETEKIPFKKK